MSLENTAHWAELISAVIASFSALGVVWKVFRTGNAIIRALHTHKEEQGFLRAENVHRLFTTAL